MMQKRSPEQYQALFREYQNGKSVPTISRESNVPTQTLYKKFADMGGRKKQFKGGTIIKKRSSPQPAPITLELANPQSSGKVVLMIVDRAQVKNILAEVF